MMKASNLSQLSTSYSLENQNCYLEFFFCIHSCSEEVNSTESQTGNLSKLLLYETLLLGDVLAEMPA